MATPTTLVELSEQRHNDWTAARQAAVTAVAQAQAAHNSAAQALAAASADFAAQERAAAQIRAQLAAITTPADGEPLLEQLELAIIAQRSAAAALLAAQSALAAAKAALAQGQASVQEADARIAQAKADWDRAKADAARRQAAKDALAAPPLDTLAADAGALLSDPVFDAAEARIEGDFPEALRDRARDRAKLARERLARNRKLAADLNGLLALHLNAKGAPADKLPGLGQAAAAAEAALLDWVSRAKERFDRARAALERVGDPDNPPLTQEQQDRIDDATLETAREDAADKEAARDQARAAHEAAVAKFEAERVEVLGEGGAEALTQALADANSDVAKAKKAMDDAAAELQVKQTAYTTVMREALDGWEAAVPESAWRDLADFDAASVALTELQAGPAAFLAALTSAEAALLAAGIAAHKEEQSLRTYRLETALPAARGEQERTIEGAAVFSALRGDG
jgi:hypothetical protein